MGIIRTNNTAMSGRNFLISISCLLVLSYFIIYSLIITPVVFNNNHDIVLFLISLLLGSYLIFIFMQAYKKKELGSPIGIYSVLIFVHFVLPGILSSVYNFNFVFLPHRLSVQQRLPLFQLYRAGYCQRWLHQ